MASRDEATDRAPHAFLSTRAMARRDALGLTGPIDPAVSLVSSGIFDSLGFLELLDEIEETFLIELDLVDADPEVFTAIDGMADLIHATVEATKGSGR